MCIRDSEPRDAAPHGLCEREVGAGDAAPPLTEEERDRGERELIVAVEERLAALAERDQPAPQRQRALGVPERRGGLGRSRERREGTRAQEVRLVGQLRRAPVSY